MSGRRRPIKRILSLLLAVIIMGSLFSSCGRAPHDTPYTLRLALGADGERQWSVKLDKRDVVSYAVQTAQDGGTDVVFTGLKRGSVDATVYLGKPGGIVRDADDVYALTLKVDARKNVTQPQPFYGAYDVRLSGDVTGSEWGVECSDERIVRWTEDREYPKKSSDEDGMQEFTQIYSFTGRRPGAAHVRIYVTYPWSEGAESTREDFWLLVDDEYRVSLLEPTDFESVVLTESGMRVEKDTYEAKRTADGVRLSHYQARSRWSDEANDYVDEKLNEVAVDGDEALYLYVAGLVHACGVRDWNGFDEYDSRVLDGTTFRFEAKLSDGTTVKANGSNAYPKHYHEFHDGLYNAVHRNASQDAAE